MSLQWWETWSPELAYVLGFSFADGAIGHNRNTLTIAQSDRAILDKMQSVVPNGDIRYSEGAKVWRLRFCEPNLNQLLGTYGILPNKTVHGFWSPDLPAEYVPHYVRGFFDGDGHVSIGYKGKFAPVVMFVCHQKTFLERLADELTIHAIDNPYLALDTGNYRLKYSTQENIVKLHDFMYTNASMYLDRKKEKFEPIIERFKNPKLIQGSNHGNALLNEDSAEQIIQLYKSGKYTQQEIGEMFGVNHRTVSRVVRREGWRHINDT